MGKTSSREWTRIYLIYGMDQWQTFAFLLCQAILFSVLSILYLHYFNDVSRIFESLLSVAAVPGGAARFAAGFTGSFTALSALCLFYAAANFFYSAVPLHSEITQRIVDTVRDWSTMRLVLDLGCCGRGILLNAVAARLKKEGNSVGSSEGVEEYVTCRTGDATRLPFSDGSFDAIVSGTFVHTVGRGHGADVAAAERGRAVAEVVRVLKEGGVGVVWDLVHVPEYVRRLQEMKMEDIRVSERVTAFMVSSHVVSFRKPTHHVHGPPEVRLDWRFC
ncbi:methyltransferase protein [Spatholobus suberectus]|nr:methyltransferase protein [Spatholobus suberectus]